MVLQNGLLVIPVPVLAAQHNYCSKNETEHCLCSNLVVTSLACDGRRPNSICQMVLAFGMGNDLSLIVIHFDLHSVLRLNSTEAASKALSTCSSHLILILFLYTVVAIWVTHLAETKATLIPVLLNVLHNIMPPSLNPMVYSLRTKKLRAGFQKGFRLSLEKKIRHLRPSPWCIGTSTSLRVDIRHSEMMGNVI